ncbi:MAG: hypothetical protein EPN20_05800 [Magnetospirillum sp.]|nr:MAG: hypothetical protein EPN20_05800 [Magnetospirillum sp.]
MDYSWEEIDQLAAMLEAELAGRRIDHVAARDLALRVAELCPDIQTTMGLVARRMAGCVEVSD